MGFPNWDSRYFHLRCSLVYSGAPHIQGPPSTKKVAKGPNFYPVANKNRNILYFPLLAPECYSFIHYCLLDYRATAWMHIA
jgi:hypothetical protein